MKKLILLILILCPVFTVAQEDDKTVEQLLTCEEWIALPTHIRVHIPPPELCILDDPVPFDKPETQNSSE